MLLKEICVLDVTCCARTTRISEAARLMRQHHTGDVVIVDAPDADRAPVGILTDRDIIVEVLANGLDPTETTVSQVMSSPLVVASGTEDASDAIDRMRQHGVRRLPVLDHDGSLMGIVTLDDILRMHAAQATAMASIVSTEQAREYRAKR